MNCSLCPISEGCFNEKMLFFEGLSKTEKKRFTDWCPLSNLLVGYSIEREDDYRTARARKASEAAKKGWETRRLKRSDKN